MLAQTKVMMHIEDDYINERGLKTIYKSTLRTT